MAGFHGQGVGSVMSGVRLVGALGRDQTYDLKGLLESEDDSLLVAELANSLAQADVPPDIVDAVEYTFIQKRFHPLTFSSKNVFTQ